MSEQEARRRRIRPLDSDSDVENEPPSPNVAPPASPREEVRVEMQRDDSFELSIFHREDESYTEDKSDEIPDEEIDKLPDIDQIPSISSIQSKNRAAAGVLLPHKIPIAVVSPLPIAPRPSEAVDGRTLSQSMPPRLAQVGETPPHSTLRRSARVNRTPLHSTPRRSARGGRISSNSMPIRSAQGVQLSSHSMPPQCSTSDGGIPSHSPPQLPLVSGKPHSTPRSAITDGTHHSTPQSPLVPVKAPAGTPSRLPLSNISSPSVISNCAAQFNTTPQITPAACMEPSTSKDADRKRQHSIAIYDSVENSKLKKAKLDDFSDDSDTGDFSDNFPDDTDTEPEMGSDEEMDSTCVNDIMPFPRQVEDINFDVRTLSKLPQNDFDFRALGDKKYAEFLRERALTSECIEELYNSLKETLNGQNDEMPDPRGLRVQLMPHQKQGLKWMKWREQRKPSGGILADDMGLGKTLQTISLVLAQKNEQVQNTEEDNDNSDEEDWSFYESDKIHDGNTLVVCLASLVRQWEKEIKTKCREGHLKVHVYHGPNRQISQAKLAKYDIVITTYNLVMQEYKYDVVPKKNKDSRIFKIHWQRVVLDEAHSIRNHQSKMSKAVCELRANSRWALTGTPIQNKEADFYALLKFLKCSPFDEWGVWRKWVSNRSSTGNQRLIVITKSLMLRRTKSELQAQDLIHKLPEKVVTTIEVHLDKDEHIVYQKLLLYSQSFFQRFLQLKKDKEHLKEFGCHMRPTLIEQEVPDKMSRLLKLLMRHHKEVGTHYILVLILRLRQICCHPALIKGMLDQEELQTAGVDKQSLSPNLLAELNKMLSDDDDDDDDDGFDIDASMAKKVMSYANPVFSDTRRSSKVKQILKVVDGILDKGEKVIIVSQWTGFLKVIRNNLHSINGARFATFSGEVNVKERQLILDRLNDPNDSLNVLLLSLTAGGVGLNLVGANNLLLIDLHWNPQLETQAQDRIYRFGQENNVHIYKFICVDTIEEKIKNLQDDKLKIAKLVLTGKVSNSLTIEDLKLLFS